MLRDRPTARCRHLSSCGRIDHPTTREAVGYGRLLEDLDGVLALPSGFAYTVLARSGETSTSDGTHPSDPDGMGVFDGGSGGTVLICNHENDGSEPHAVPAVEGMTYDRGASGGTSTLVVDADGNRLSQYTSLAGTVNNCAGGVTPWGTWLSCEETSVRAGEDGFTKDHGYVFEVDPESREANLGRSPVPLKFLGRYSHEAVAIDPSTTQIYLTEDAGDPNGLYFRWTPPTGFVPGRGALHELAESDGGDVAGVLHAMRCLQDGTVVQDLAEATSVGTPYEVEWIDVPDRDGQDESVRRQFSDDAISRAHELEGQRWGDEGVYFVSSCSPGRGDRAGARLRSGPQRLQRLGVLRPHVLQGREALVRQHPAPGPPPGHHGSADASVPRAGRLTRNGRPPRSQRRRGSPPDRVVRETSAVVTPA